MSCDNYTTICELNNLTSNVSPSPSWLAKLFLVLTRLHFSNAKHYGTPFDELMKDIVWSEDANSRLVVELNSPEGATIAGCHIPGVYINVGEFQFGQDVIGDAEGPDDANASMALTVRASSILQIVCLHEAATASSNMASTALVFMQACKNFFRNLGIVNFRPDTLRGPMPMKAATFKYFQSILMFRFQFNQRVSIGLGGHILRDISIDARPFTE